MGFKICRLRALQIRELFDSCYEAAIIISAEVLKVEIRSGICCRFFFSGASQEQFLQADPGVLCACVCARVVVRKQEEEEPGFLRCDNMLQPRLSYLPFPAV